jgi:glucose/arabinose dehydrogenase
MNPTASKAIFGIGIILAAAAFISIYVASVAQQSQNSQGTATSTSNAATQGQSKATAAASLSSTTATQSSNTSNRAISSINIVQGSAAQQVKVYYQPTPAQVTSGSKVTWTNNDIAPHTATASDFSFDTGIIAVSSSGSAVVKGKGNLSYRCTIHPWMTSTLQISGSDQSNNSQSPASNVTSVANTTSHQVSITAPRVNDTNLKVTEVISGLKMPTTMAFLGPDDFLLLLKGGTVVRVTNGTMASTPLLNVSVGSGITQGMLGIVLSNYSLPDNGRYVFLYYTEVLNNQTGSQLQGQGEGEGEQQQNNQTGMKTLENRVYRYEFVNGSLINPKLLLQLPAKEGYMDNGGYLKIGPDNNLYMSVGAITASAVSDVQTLTQNFINGTPVDGRAGILRIMQNGNPVLDKEGHGLLGDSHPLNLYYGYVLKDSFGIDFDPISGKLWDAEPGRIIDDEINLIEPGFNGGFEALQGPSVYVPAAVADLVNFNGSGKYYDPQFVWNQKVVPVGLKFLTTSKLGEKYENDLFVGSFLNGKIYHFDLNEARDGLVVPSSFIYNQMVTWNSMGAEDITFGEGFGGISSLNVGPDGYLYVVSFTNGKIYKIMPS